MIASDGMLIGLLSGQGFQYSARGSQHTPPVGLHGELLAHSALLCPAWALQEPCSGAAGGSQQGMLCCDFQSSAVLVGAGSDPLR